MKLRHKLLCVSSLVSNFVKSIFKAFEKFIFTEKVTTEVIVDLNYTN